MNWMWPENRKEHLTPSSNPEDSHVALTLGNAVRLEGRWGYFSLTTVLCEVGIIILTSEFRKMSLKEVRWIATGHTTSSDRARLQPPTRLIPCWCFYHCSPCPFPSPPVSPQLCISLPPYHLDPSWLMGHMEEVQSLGTAYSSEPGGC